MNRLWIHSRVVWSPSTQILAVQQTEVPQLRNAVDRIDPSTEVEVSFINFPWSKIAGEEVKLISKANGALSPFDFSAQSMKAWRTKFSRLSNYHFVTAGMVRIAIVWNTCTDSTKSRILFMGIGEWTKKEEFTFSDLLKIICVLYSSPNHSELAMQSLYVGVQQSPDESVPIYLECVRCFKEDGFGPAVR